MPPGSGGRHRSARPVANLAIILGRQCGCGDDEVVVAIVRGRAAEELAARPEARGMVPRLIAPAEGPDPRVRQGACEALGLLGAREAVRVLVRLLVHDDRWLLLERRREGRRAAVTGGRSVMSLQHAWRSRW